MGNNAVGSKLEQTNWAVYCRNTSGHGGARRRRRPPRRPAVRAHLPAGARAVAVVRRRADAGLRAVVLPGAGAVRQGGAGDSIAVLCWSPHTARS